MQARQYDAWYHSPRGRWIADTEQALMLRLLRPLPGSSLLDVGGGTGQFGRRFAQVGLEVVNLDPEPAMLAQAHRISPAMPAVLGDARALPFGNGAFDYCAAVTSLCFVAQPDLALAEMWRVSRLGVVLGLLNRNSLLHMRKQGQGGYQGARWDSMREVEHWCAGLRPQPRIRSGTCVLLPGGGWLARRAESCIPASIPWGGFLAVALLRPNSWSSTGI